MQNEFFYTNDCSLHTEQTSTQSFVGLLLLCFGFGKDKENTPFKLFVHRSSVSLQPETHCMKMWTFRKAVLSCMWYSANKPGLRQMCLCCPECFILLFILVCDRFKEVLEEYLNCLKPSTASKNAWSTRRG